jgi:non-specific protein-tyrosine kinase
LEQVAQKLRTQKPPKAKVELPVNTELMEITVEDRDPALAAEAANTLAAILIARAEELSVGSGKTAQQILGERLAQLGAEIQQARQAEQGTIPSEGAAVAAVARRSIEAKEQAYAKLLEQYEQARLLDALRANTISVVEPAVVPDAPAKPRKALSAALALVVGAVAGTGLGFLFESLDAKASTASKGAPATGSSSLASPPAAGGDRSHSLSDVPSPLHAAFGRARAHVAGAEGRSNGHGSAQAVLITRTQAGEDKSTTAANLAYVIARSGRKVVVVDGDLRRPTLHEIFGLRNDVGLSSVLRRDATLDEALQDSHIPGIRVLTSGPPSPGAADLLASPRMTGLFQELAERSDMVLIDSPSLAGLAGASALPRGVDGVVLCSW